MSMRSFMFALLGLTISMILTTLAMRDDLSRMKSASSQAPVATQPTVPATNQSPDASASSSTTYPALTNQ